MTEQEMKDEAIVEDKQLRIEMDRLIEQILRSPRKSAERTLSLRSLQVARMWLGEDLRMLDTPYPYPNSVNASNTVVDPATDKYRA